MNDWVDDEFMYLDLGDKRVNAKGKAIINTLAKQPGASIPKAFNTWSEIKSCYEFFANGKVTGQKILSPHLIATRQRLIHEKVVLMPTDTSALNYTSKPSIKELGNIGNVNLGIFLHPLIAITPERVNLGIVDAKVWARSEKEIKLTDHQRYSLPIEEKERYRWIESYKVACDVAKECPNTQVITITDREGDFAEHFEAVLKAQEQNEKYADIIVRSYHDRAVISSDKEDLLHQGKQNKLKSKLKAARSLGEIKFKIPATQHRHERIVTQTLKATSVTFKKRATSKAFVSPKVTINAVMAIEENPPEGIEPLIWVFLTTLPIDTFEQVVLVIQYYLVRWEIEVFFKILKSGSDVEERRLKECESLISLIAVFLVIAWRVMYVMKLSRSCPEISCEEVFSASEWKSVFKITKRGTKLPDKAPLLGEFIRMVASLGGYLDRKNDPAPGPKVIWIGLNRMHDFAIAWETFGN